MRLGVIGIEAEGADLTEFVNGVADLLRALMQRRLGAEVDGLTEGLRNAIDGAGSGFSEGDVLRMLRFLEEAEGAIRRSPNSRLHVETLLVQWALLDRTVEIAEVLAALRGGSVAGSPPTPVPSRRESQASPSPRRAAAPPASEPRPRSGAAPATKPPPPVTAAPAPAPSDLDGAPDLDRVNTDWDAVLEYVGARKPLVREVLSQSYPRAVSGNVVSLEVPHGDLSLEGLTRNRGLVEEALASIYGGKFRVELVPPGAGESLPTPGPDATGRQTVEGDREARLRAYRNQDPALDAVADALDLELLD